MRARNVVTTEEDFRKRGYAVLPVPRRAALSGANVKFDPTWRLRLKGLGADDVAVETLTEGLGFTLKHSSGAKKELVLTILPGSVKTGFTDSRNEQAYSLEISPLRISLVGNGKPGLFYAVQTLLQLLDGRNRGILPVGRIVDWPQYEIRAMHWDTKHQQDRPETLRRFLDQAARFKINAVIYELEDKFAYPSHPVIGAPGAWTTKQLQSLVDYGLRRHIRIIPNVQAPAHMGFVLKHAEFAHLRCDGSRYQICMDEPEARKLIFDMYDDLCEATKGVDLFHVSTDEVYYAGICEKFRKPYNPVNRSLTWVDYVNAAHAHLAEKGRRVIVWLEYPLLPEHIKLLPKDLLNGIGPGKPEWIEAQDRHGMRQFIYSPVQGEELLFPAHFDYVDKNGKTQPGRLQQAFEATRDGYRKVKDSIGTVAAAWDDSGLHNETFWLGWAVMAQGSWTPGVPVEKTVDNFMDLFHGREPANMLQVYRDLHSGARFYENSLEQLPSIIRGPAYGYSQERRPVNRTDYGMIPPALPDPVTLAVDPVFRRRYAAILDEVPAQIEISDRLIKSLQQKLSQAKKNRYSLEVFRSIALLIRYHLDMLIAVAAAEDAMRAAARFAAKGKRRQALASMNRVVTDVQRVVAKLETTYGKVKNIWEKGHFPKGRSVRGRRFIYVMDDVKDHRADRSPDLRYLILPEERMGLKEWVVTLKGKVKDTVQNAPC